MRKAARSGQGLIGRQGDNRVIIPVTNRALEDGKQERKRKSQLGVGGEGAVVCEVDDGEDAVHAEGERDVRARSKARGESRGTEEIERDG